MAARSHVLNRLVNFRIIDVWHPDPDDLLRELHGDDLLQGVVTDISAGESPETNFVVVQIEGRGEPVIVSMNRITEVL